MYFYQGIFYPLIQKVMNILYIVKTFRERQQFPWRHRIVKFVNNTTKVKDHGFKSYTQYFCYSIFNLCGNIFVILSFFFISEIILKEKVD